MTADDAEVHRYAELMFDAFDAADGTEHRLSWYDREGGGVDADVHDIVRALLAADWRPPSAEPCTWCEHTRSRHSAGGCADCGCTMPYGGS